MQKFFSKLFARPTTIAFLACGVACQSGCEPVDESQDLAVNASARPEALSAVALDMGVAVEAEATFDTGSVRFDSWDLLHAEFSNWGDVPVRIEIEILDDQAELVLSRRIEVGPGESSRSSLNVPGSTQCRRFDYQVRYTVYYPDPAHAASPDAGFDLQFRSSDPEGRTYRGQCHGLDCSGYDFSTNAPIADIGALDCQGLQ